MNTSRQLPSVKQKFRDLYGTYHQVSKKHLQRYATEFAERSIGRELEVIDQIRRVIAGMHGKRLPYKELIA